MCKNKQITVHVDGSYELDSALQSPQKKQASFLHLIYIYIYT